MQMSFSENLIFHIERLSYNFDMKGEANDTYIRMYNWVRGIWRIYSVFDVVDRDGVFSRGKNILSRSFVLLYDMVRCKCI